MEEGSVAGDVRIWELTPSWEPVPMTASGGKHTVAFSPDGSLVAACGQDNSVKVWDAHTGLERHSFPGHTKIVYSVAFSPDGKRLASASEDHSVRLWDLTTDKELSKVDGHGYVIRTAFSPDGGLLATVGWGTDIRLCAAGTGQVVRTLTPTKGVINDAWVAGVAFTPDGDRLITGAIDEQIRVWNVHTGEEILSFNPGIGPVIAVTIAPDGKRLAAAAFKGKTVTIHEAATGRLVLVLRGHTSGINTVAFSRDGNRLVTAGSDGTVRIWEARTGQELLVLKGHTGEVYGAEFSPDGRCVVSTGQDRTVRLWGDVLPPQDPLEQESLARVKHLFGEHILRKEVIDRLQADPGMGEAVRRRALEIAQRYPGDPADLVRRSWAVLRSPGADPAAYQLALRQARAAFELAANPQEYFTPLAVAQYRVGEYREAVAMLNRAPAGPVPADLAFLALAHERLGQRDEAVKVLEQLRRLMTNPRWAQDAEANGFLREAEEGVGKEAPK
jgi:WD40 repeat protein